PYSREHQRYKKENDGDHPDPAACQLQAALRDLVESAVNRGLTEEEHDTDQGQKQTRRKSSHHFGNAHPAEHHTNKECKRDGEKTDIETRDTTDDDCRGQSDNRQNW